MFAPTHGVTPFSHTTAQTSLFTQMEWWLVRQFDALATRGEAKRGAALLTALDDRTLADIGYGDEDVYRPGHN